MPDTNQPTDETARALLWRHNLPEDVIDGALCLHAQELAAQQRAVIADDSPAWVKAIPDLIEPGALPPATFAALPSAPADQTALRDRIASAIDGVFTRWQTGLSGQRPQDAIRDAVLAVLPAPVEEQRRALAIVLGLDADAGWDTIRARAGELRQDVRRLGLMVDEYGQGAGALTDKLKRVRDLHRETCIVACCEVKPTSFTCSTCDLLDAPAAPLLADAASGPGRPADEAQPRSDVGTEFVQQADHPDVAGLDAVDAELAAEAQPLRGELTPFQLLGDVEGPLPQTERVVGSQRLGSVAQPASQPDGEANACGQVPNQCDAEAGEPCPKHEREAAHAEGEHAFCGPECSSQEIIHACPPVGSGLTPCCGRTPFELPLTDRISTEAPVTCPGPTS
ncbi:hypothetical protein [Streptomyces sp. NPDC004324]